MVLTPWPLSFAEPSQYFIHALSLYTLLKVACTTYMYIDFVHVFSVAAILP